MRPIARPSRRFTRLTNAFSKKVENLTAAVSLHFMWYNFGRPHQTLGRNVTSAMAAGVTDHVWTAEEIAGLVVWRAATLRAWHPSATSKLA